MRRRSPILLMELLVTRELHRRAPPGTATTSTGTATTPIRTTTRRIIRELGRLILGVENGLRLRFGLGYSRFLHLEKRARLEEGWKRGLERNQVYYGAKGFGKPVKSLEDELLVRDGMTDIGQLVGNLFNGLAIIMNGHRAFLERFEFFFELDSAVVFVVGEERGKIGPKGVGGCGFRENHTREVVGDCAVNPGL